MLLKKYEKLSELLSKKVVDWAEIEAIIGSLGNNINDKYNVGFCDDGTILSELYLDSGRFGRGEVLVELTKLFLQYGYDVHANNDFNGAICLHNLCWSSYDKYVLHTAELLLATGANTHIKIEDDYEDGILNSISWKLGYWHTGEYNSANMFEAYYQMVKTEQAGEDYFGIRDVSDCLNMTATKVECFNNPIIANNRIYFNDAIVIWFDSTPLVADKYTELVVNPNRVNKQIHRIDISDEFVKIVGHKFIRYRFSDEEHVSLFFDNDIKLVLSSKQLTGEEEVSGCLDIKSKFAPVKTSKQSYPFLLNRKY